MTLEPVFKTRAFSDRPQPWHRFAVQRCAWSALGGPRSARLVARAVHPLDLSALAALLRCPLELWDSGRRAWWGLVWTVTVRDHATGLVFSLDDLVNRARVSYAELADSMRAGGRQAFTPWADDLQSQAAYGVKEAQPSLLAANATVAARLRDDLLTRLARPAGRAVAAPPARDLSITLDCRGWWDTLAWRTYTQSAGLVSNVPNTPPMGQSFGMPAELLAAQTFQTAVGGWRLETVWAALRKVGAPADTFTVLLYSDSAGLPGVLLDSAAAVAGASLPLNGFVWTKFSMLAPYTLTAAVPYWLILYRNGAASAVDYYRVMVDEGLNYPGGFFCVYNGSAYVARYPAADLQFVAAGRMSNDAQIRLMAAAASGGQFLAGVRLDVPTGLYSNPSRPGSQTAQAELRSILAAGSTAGELLASVSAERYLVIRLKPSASAEPKYRVGSDGLVRLPSGMLAPPSAAIAGQWAALTAAGSSTAPAGGLVPGRVFLNAVQWSPAGVQMLNED